MITIVVKDGDRYYRADLTVRQAAIHDNGALISCGLGVPSDLRRSTLTRWVNAGVAKEISHDDWNHSSCLSSCVNRGGSSCRW